MTDSTSPALQLRESAPAEGYGFLYVVRTARAWWYCAWLRSLARFSRTYFGSFWLGLSNLLSVALLGAVYGTVFKVADPIGYVIYLGLGLTIWGWISQSVIGGCSLLTVRRDQLVNNALPAIFYCLEEWAFQLQTFGQAFALILVAFALMKPILLLNAIGNIWIPLINLGLFCFWITIATAMLGARFKDVGQLMPILLQLVFLVSPILYHKEGLGKVGVFADFNPFYRVLAPVRAAVIDGTVALPSQLAALVLNLLVIAAMVFMLKRLRYRLPLWV